MYIKNTTGKEIIVLMILFSYEMLYLRYQIWYSQLVQKLNGPKTSSKTYWPILKTFYNSKKVPLISPLFINNKLEQDFKLKANFLNKFFTDKWTPIQNNSVIPNFIECKSMDRLTSIVFNDKRILKIIRALDVKKHMVMMIYQFEWSSYATNLSFQQYHYSIRIASTQKFSLIYGRDPMLSQFIRRVISKLLTITDQFHFYQSLVKYLKSLFLIHCLNFFIKIICLIRINQDSYCLIHVNISSYQLYMAYMHLLTVIHLMMSEVHF